MNVIVRNIPNSVTCLNLAAGTVAIIFAFRGLEPVGALQGWTWACIFIAIAAVADFLDGFCARMLRAYSDLGKELDSLCDLVSFGVAPALTVFNLLPEEGAIHWLKWCLLLIPICAAVRLARFNIDTRQASFFIGLPVPANAIFWMGYCGLIVQGANFLMTPGVFFPILLVECWLMLSPLKLFSLKFSNYRLKGNEARYLLIAGSAFLIFCMGMGALLWIVIYYLFISLFFSEKS